MRPTPNAIRVVNRGNHIVDYTVASSGVHAMPEIRTLAPNNGGIVIDLLPDQVLVVGTDLAAKAGPRPSGESPVVTAAPPTADELAAMAGAPAPLALQPIDPTTLPWEVRKDMIVRLGGLVPFDEANPPASEIARRVDIETMRKYLTEGAATGDPQPALDAFYRVHPHAYVGGVDLSNPPGAVSPLPVETKEAKMSGKGRRQKDGS